MNFLFKIKHYLLLYFKTSLSYKFNDAALNKFDHNYWISGYKKNIETGKWQIENGIPLGLYNGKMDAPLWRRVHIAGLCEFCYAQLELGTKEKQEVVVDFLINNLLGDHIALKNNTELNFLVWRTFFDNDSSEYYVHGMGQGQILSLLTRYAGSENSLLKEKIILISNSYLVPLVHPLGFVNTVKGSEIILEEYPKSPERLHVLNGWMYSLIGLHDYLCFAKNNNINDCYLEEKKDLFNKSLMFLSQSLPSYNIGFWSLYNLPKGIEHIASIHYQEQHIVLLKALGEITQTEKFIDYSNTFKRQFNNPIYRLLSLFIKIFISNLIKHKWIYKVK